MSWQRERVEEQRGSIKELDMAITKIHNLLEEILGVSVVSRCHYTGAGRQ